MRTTWRRLLAARARRPARDAFGYADPAGYPPLREALTEYLKRARGVLCEADQIVITSGSQQGFDLAARVLLDPGDALTFAPHFPHTFRSAADDSTTQVLWVISPALTTSSDLRRPQ